MALYSDLNEIKQFWKNASLLGRIILLFSTFLAISSITSLSDTIFQWKGFILDGLNFYKAYITTPLSIILSKLDFNLKPTSSDVIIIILLGLSAQIRKLTLNGYSNFSNKIKIIMIITTIFYTIFVVIFFAFILSLPLSDTSDDIIFLTMTIIFIIYNPIRKKYNTQEKLRYYSPIVFAIISVLILAAINIGLTKPITLM